MILQIECLRCRQIGALESLLCDGHINRHLWFLVFNHDVRLVQAVGQFEAPIDSKLLVIERQTKEEHLLE